MKKFKNGNKVKLLNKLNDSDSLIPEMTGVVVLVKGNYLHIKWDNWNNGHNGICGDLSKENDIWVVNKDDVELINGNEKNI